jgi:hypothetical protein
MLLVDRDHFEIVAGGAAEAKHLINASQTAVRIKLSVQESPFYFCNLTD